MKDFVNNGEKVTVSTATSEANGNNSINTTVFNSRISHLNSSNSSFHGLNGSSSSGSSISNSGSLSPSPFLEEKKMTTEDDINKFMGTFEMLEIEDHSDIPQEFKFTPPTPVQVRTKIPTPTSPTHKQNFFNNIFNKDLFNKVNVFSNKTSTTSTTTNTAPTIDKSTTTTTTSLNDQNGNNITQTSSTTTTTTTTPTTGGKNIISNLYYKVKYSIISPETEEALSHINSLFDKLFGDIPYSKFQIFLGLMLLDNYYSNSHFNSQSYVVDKEFVKTAGQYMRFASATFGWKYINGYLYSKSAKGLFKGVTGGDSLNNDLLCEYCGISKGDIVLTKWTSSNFDPGHYIAYNHKDKSIVLAIRGTFHARDILTDLVAKETKFYDGYVHSGILKCAENKFAELAPILLEHYHKKESEGYRIIVVGHSLGAGVASLFSIMFKANYPDIPIHCYAYAPPSLASTEISLSVEYRSLIDTFVFNDDIIPRLCYASLEHLLELVLCILKKNESITQLGFQILAAGNTFGDQVTDKIGNLLKLKKDTMLKYQELHLSNKTMLPPGRIFRIYKPTPTETHYVMEESNPSFFKEIIISNTLLTDHMPDKYEFAFKSCLENLNSVIPSFLSNTTTQQLQLQDQNQDQDKNPDLIVKEVVNTTTSKDEHDKTVITNVEVVNELVITHNNNSNIDNNNNNNSNNS